METKAELAKAILAVMKDVKGIEKSMNVGTGNSSYKGVADQDVKKVVGESMERNGLCILPIETTPKTQIDRWEAPGYNGGLPTTKQSVFTEVNTKYLLLHESGESQVISGYGQGVDSQDKGAGKATTYALKYALLYTFLIPTGKIDDADKDHSDTHSIPASNPTTNGKPELKQGTPAYKKAVIHISQGGSMDQVKKSYTVPEATEALIFNEAKTVSA